MVDTSVSLSMFLREFEDAGAFGMQWLNHNSNGLIKRPTVGPRKAFTSCIDDYAADGSGVRDNRHIKSWVQTRYFAGFTSPHSFITNCSTLTLGEDHDPVDYAYREPITRNRIALHHYVIKSREQFLEKMSRWEGDNPKDDSFFNYINAQSRHNCTSLVAYYP